MGCGIRIKVLESRAGTSCVCPKCKTPISVPPLPEVQADPAEPDEESESESRPRSKPEVIVVTRQCDDCGKALTEDEYGGYFHYEGNNFHGPTRFYYCVECYEERCVDDEINERRENFLKVTGYFFLGCIAFLFLCRFLLW